MQIKVVFCPSTGSNPVRGRQCSHFPRSVLLSVDIDDFRQQSGLSSRKLRAKELDFVKARDAIVVSSLTDRQKMAALCRLEVEHCRRLAKQPRLQREVKRRIAETLFDMSVWRGLTIASCRARLNSLARLGFTNIEQKGHWHLIYARLALAQGHPRIALNAATGMVLELRHSLTRRRSLLGRELLGHLEQLSKRAIKHLSDG
jgi:hypothetical protein